MDRFTRAELKNLFEPKRDSVGEDNGKVLVIGGSELFHGAPLLALKAASRLVDMVFFATPTPSVGAVAERVKSNLFSFIWVPWDEVDEYVEKAEVILIGPGFMRYKNEKVPHGQREHECDEACRITRDITERLLLKFPHKKWVIDAGSLQTMKPEWIPEAAILTPNRKEFQILFNVKSQMANVKLASQILKLVQQKAKQYDCVIVWKGPVSYACSPEKCVEIRGGNPGLTKGGTGDTLAGVTAGLYAKNGAVTAAAAGSFVVKAAADRLFERVGVNYNADDLVDEIPLVFGGAKGRD